MATHAGPVKGKDEAADSQTDVTETDKSRRDRVDTPDRQGHKAEYHQHQNNHLNNANNVSKDYDAELSTSIHSLPPELMAKIFSKLNCQDKVRVACVCSKWRDLIDIPSIWRDFCPFIDVDNLTSKHIQKMHIRMISKVKIYKCTSVEKMTTFLKGVPHLKNLSCIFTYSLSTMFQDKETFPGMEQITVNCFELNTGVLRSFLKRMVNLQHLRVNCIPDEDIFCALQHSKNLVSLSIKCNRDVLKLTGPSMGDLNPVSSMKQLTLVNVTVGDSGLDFVSRKFPQLCALQLMLSSDVTYDGLEKLAKLKELKSLTIGSGHFEHGWMENLDTKLPQLEVLILSGCRSISNECLQSISKMPALRVLQVPIQDEEVEGLHALSQGCSGLENLCLQYGNQSINTSLHVATHMPNLEELNLVNCTVTDDFWREHSKSFSKLKRLSFTECQLVSVQCLPYLSQMACLEELWLGKCVAVGNESIKYLGEGRKFNTLISIMLTDLEIKDDSLVEFSKHAPILKKLMIVSCKNVTEKGLAAAMSNLSHLEVLVTYKNAEIKDRLKRIRPHLPK